MRHLCGRWPFQQKQFEPFDAEYGTPTRIVGAIKWPGRKYATGFSGTLRAALRTYRPGFLLRALRRQIE